MCDSFLPNKKWPSAYSGTIHVDAPSVSEGIRPYLQQIDPSRSALISAQTGYGKTTFILKEYIPYFFRAPHRVLLIVSNRIALYEQIRKALSNSRLFFIETQHDDHCVIFGNPFPQGPNHWVILCKYHNLSKQLLDILQTAPPYLFTYSIVLDEAHYFTSDALFNHYTSYTLETLITHAYFATRIYMTATPDDVLPLLCYYENRASERIKSDLNNKAYLSWRANYHVQPPLRVYSINGGFHMIPPLTVYSFPRNFSSYNCRYFRLFSEIQDLIFADTSSEKWLIFVNSKKEGLSLKNKLSKKVSVSYLDANKEDARAWSEIINDNSFSSKVLIATNVLDNGVNILDPDLKNIVISFCDKTTFLQRLGRKRLSGPDTIQIYIQDLPSDILKQRMSHMRKYQNLMHRYHHNPLSIIYEYWNSPQPEIRNLFFLASSGQRAVTPAINPAAKAEIHALSSFYQHLFKENEAGNSTAYLDLAMSWLSKTYDEGSFISSFREIFDQEIRKYLNRSLDRTEFNNLVSDLNDLKKKYVHYFAGNISLRAGNEKSFLQHLLKALDLPYEIKKENNLFRVIESPLTLEK